MLKELTVKNLRSFNEEVTFSMEADVERVGEFKEHIVELTNNKLLKVASMYGPNGGGKTNLIYALTLAKILLGYSNRTFSKASKMQCVFSEDKITEETLFFVDEKYELGFHFKINCELEEKEFPLEKVTIYRTIINIIEETVVYRNINEKEFNVLYERDVTGNVESSAFSKLGIKLPNLAKGKTVLSKIYEEYADNDFVNDNCLDVVKRLFEEIESIVQLDSNRNMLMPPSLLSLAKQLNEKKPLLVNLLNSVDIKISNINVYDDRPERIYFEREIEVKDQLVTREIPFSLESAGTQKIFYIFLKMINAFSNKKIFYCDDMNAYLHPKLYRAIIELFNSDLNKNCQLIFNSHDITNMTNELFRRDEIWFVYRDENYSSKLVPLSNIVNYKGEQVRKDAKYNKQYLEGKYGADPFIKKGLSWND